MVITPGMKKRKEARRIKRVMLCDCRRHRLSQQSPQERMPSTVAVWDSGSQGNFTDPCSLVLWIPLRYLSSSIPISQKSRIDTNLPAAWITIKLPHGQSGPCSPHAVYPAPLSIEGDITSEAPWGIRLESNLSKEEGVHCDGCYIWDMQNWQMLSLCLCSSGNFFQRAWARDLSFSVDYMVFLTGCFLTPLSFEGGDCLGSLLSLLVFYLILRSVYNNPLTFI